MSWSHFGVISYQKDNGYLRKRTSKKCVFKEHSITCSIFCHLVPQFSSCYFVYSVLSKSSWCPFILINHYFYGSQNSCLFLFCFQYKYFSVFILVDALELKYLLLENVEEQRKEPSLALACQHFYVCECNNFQ